MPPCVHDLIHLAEAVLRPVLPSADVDGGRCSSQEPPRVEVGPIDLERARKVLHGPCCTCQGQRGIWRGAPRCWAGSVLADELSFAGQVEAL